MTATEGVFDGDSGAVYPIVSCLVRERAEQREQGLDFVQGD
jgi:hypothetical protein